MINLYMPLVEKYVVPLMIWDAAWKGVAMWKASKKGNKYWFVALFVVNSVGILPILYIYLFSKWKRKEKSEAK